MCNEIHPDSKLCKICTIIDGPALIQVLGKPAGCVNTVVSTKSKSDVRLCLQLLS